MPLTFDYPGNNCRLTLAPTRARQILTMIGMQPWLSYRQVSLIRR